MLSNSISNKSLYFLFIIFLLNISGRATANEIYRIDFEGAWNSQYFEWGTNETGFFLNNNGINFIRDPYSINIPGNRFTSNSIVPNRVSPGASTGSSYDGVWVLKSRLYPNNDGLKDRSQIVVRNHTDSDGVKLAGSFKYLGFAWKSVYTPNDTTDTFSMIGYQQKHGSELKNVPIQLLGRKVNGDFRLILNIFDSQENLHQFSFRTGSPSNVVIHNNDWNTTVIRTELNGESNEKSRVLMWINGVKVFHKSTIKIGYQPNSNITRDFKTTLGIYRGSSHGKNDLITMYFDNIKWADSYESAIP